MASLTISTVEMHTGGEPLRVIKSGVPEIVGNTILDKRQYVKENLDYIRKFLMFEPRGHYDMYGALPVTPDIPEADAAFLFMHNEGYSTMCGHAVIALGRYCIDQKIVKYEEPESQVNIQCPCGLVKAFVTCSNCKTERVRFESVPAFVLESNVQLAINGVGQIEVDVCYGGAFYAFVDTNFLGSDFFDSKIEDIKQIALQIKQAVVKNVNIQHPYHSQLGFLYGVIFTNDKSDKDISQILCVFADSQVDRSPCGSGVTAKMALLHSNEKTKVNEEKAFENPKTKSRFTSKVVKKTLCGQHEGVIVEVSGNAFYTGQSTFTAEKEDCLQSGFLLV